MEIAKRFAAMGRQDITFVFGSGSGWESLPQAAKLAGVDSWFVCHGHCNKLQMREMLNRAHAVIVPTRRQFTEGFNKVLAEGILSGRPVITSRICPAIFYVQEAVVQVAPGDRSGYGDDLLKLWDNHDFYEEKQQSCLALQAQFSNSEASWGAALKSILMVIQKSTEPDKVWEMGQTLP